MSLKNRWHVAWALLVAVLVSLCLLWWQTAQYLLATNDGLQQHIAALQSAPHAVHDAQLTAFSQPDGTLLIVVNGLFEHRVYSPCASKPL